MKFPVFVLAVVGVVGAFGHEADEVEAATVAAEMRTYKLEHECIVAAAEVSFLDQAKMRSVGILAVIRA